MTPEIDTQFLLQALEEAKKRKGQTAPNPSVGAVVAMGETVLATGYHLQAGAPHAEVMALGRAKNLPAGATLYVTLEPCCHQGKTPPCTDLILDNKLKRVVFGFVDPNPVVAGKGQMLLQKAGIECTQRPLPEIDEFYRSYAYWTKTKLPYVTGKLALSLDGKIAGPQGRPVKITGEALDRFTHLHRKHADALLTTVRTILKDDPQLNVRFDGEVLKKNLYILDQRLELPLSAKVFATAEKLTVFCGPDAPADARRRLGGVGVEVSEIPLDGGKLDLKAAIRKIGMDGKHDLWVEAGGRLFSTLIDQQLLQKALIYVSPQSLGLDAYPAFRKEIPGFARAVSAVWRPFGTETCLELTFPDANPVL